jgi:hypothetical protein
MDRWVSIFSEGIIIHLYMRCILTFVHVNVNYVVQLLLPLSAFFLNMCFVLTCAFLSYSRIKWRWCDWKKTVHTVISQCIQFSRQSSTSYGCSRPKLELSFLIIIITALKIKPKIRNFNHRALPNKNSWALADQLNLINPSGFVEKANCYCITAYLNWVYQKSTYLNIYVNALFHVFCCIQYNRAVA